MKKQKSQKLECSLTRPVESLSTEFVTEPKNVDITEAQIQQATELLESVDVNYLRTRHTFPSAPKSKDGLRGALMQRNPDIFEVATTGERRNTTRAASTATRRSQGGDKARTGSVLEVAVTKSGRKRSSQSSSREVSAVVAQDRKGEKLGETFQSFLEDFFEKTDRAANDEGDSSSYVKLTRELNDHLEELSKHNLLHSAVPVDSVLRLQDVLDGFVMLAEGKLLQDTEEGDSSDFQDILVAVEAAGANLSIMTAADMSRKVYKEESIQKLVHLANYHTTHNVFVAHDAYYRQLYRSNDDKCEDLEDEEFTGSGKKKKRRKSSNTSKGQSNRASSKPLQTLMCKLSLLYGKLGKLLQILKVQDSCVMDLSNTALLILTVEDIQHLQLGAVDILSTIFVHYREHRSMVLDELLDTFLKIPTGKRNLRNFSLLEEEEEKQIQMVSAVLLHCIQGCPSFSTEQSYGVQSKNANGEDGDAESTYRHAKYWTQYFWKGFLRRHAQARTQEIKFSVLVENLVSDVLAVLSSPEWPAASLLLQGLCAVLRSQLSDPTAGSLRSIATEILGKVLAHHKVDASDCEDDKLWDFTEDFWSTSDFTAADKERKLLQRLMQDAKRQLELVQKNSDVVTPTEPGEKVALLRQVLLGYLVGVEKRHTDVAPRLAQTFLVFQWADTDGSDCALSLHRARMEEARKLSTAIEMPRDLGVRLIRWFFQHRPQTTKEMNDLFHRLLYLLEDSNTGARERVIKALGVVVEADPRTLRGQAIQVAVERRLSDSAISVRKAAVELVGKYVGKSAEYGDRYYKAIMDRITDVGVSVRKCVLGILQECMIDPGFNHTVPVLVRIMARIKDEEPSIQQLVCEVFQKKIFAGPIKTLEARTQLLVGVVGQVYESQRQQGHISFPLTAQFPFVEVSARILKGEDKVSHDTEMHSAARSLCSSLLEGILRAKEDVSGAGGPALPFAVTLHTLCTADAHLCIPEDNPLRFVRTLQPYLELSLGNSSSKVHVDEANLLMCMLSVIDAVLEVGKTLPSDLAEALKQNLTELLTRHPFHGVLFLSAQCLCTLGKVYTGAAESVVALVRRFHLHLEQCYRKIEAANQQLHAKRGLFVLGQLSRFGCPFISRQRPGGTTMAGIMQMFLQYMQPGMTMDIRCKAMQACGFLLIAQPEMLLEAGSPIDKLMCEALTSTTAENFKEQALSNLCEMVKAEENQMVKLQHAQMEAIVTQTANKAELPKTVGQGDNCLSGSIIQRYWDIVLGLATKQQSASKVRLKVLQLAEVVLRHGLVHPMSCIAQIMALGGDPEKVIRRLAGNLLTQLDDKYHSFVTDRLPDGLRLTFHFQTQIVKLQNARTQAPTTSTSLVCSAEGREGITVLYQKFRTQRTERNRFLTVLLRRFEASAFKPDELPLLRFHADLLAHLPYHLLEEPLFVVHWLNRVISVRSGTLASQLKSAIAEHKPQDEATDPNPEGIHPAQRPAPMHLDPPSAIPSEALQADCIASIVLAIMLKLKGYLRLQYGLTDVRVQAFSPTDTVKGQELAQAMTEDLPLDVGNINLHSYTTFDLIEQQYLTFKTLMKEDSNDFAAEYVKPKGRGRTSATPGSGRTSATPGSGRTSATPGSGRTSATPASGRGRGRGSGSGRGTKRKASGKKQKGNEEDEEDEDDDDYDPSFRSTAKRLAPLMRQ
ncbi:hypothetical protein CYMTET_3531 [Cymbomonas tetramitiformis]|uniref:Sister chromatid cohesion protein n=1 Tax=Cymbomonas tetramitiformis TaxID=36881 RepID=A0AAE0H396_9CHLO|nr:hypothetical protein CYMTET_3531 [Cymbomonas tetramitiformis]